MHIQLYVAMSLATIAVIMITIAMALIVASVFFKLSVHFQFQVAS